MTDEPWRLDTGALRSLVAERKVSALEALESCLERVETLNGAVNAVCTFNPRAREDALEVDRRLAGGGEPRPLEGVPFLVKDNIDTGGLRTTYGSLVRADNVPAEDAISVERLKAAGAVVVGKSNVPEFAHDVVTTNAIFGTTRNPWDLRRTSGGSSGGTGAAVAAGMVPFGLGTDLGGSIRAPASYNGICGMRPAPGAVPVNATDFAWDTLVSHVQGPMARTATDLCRLMSVLAAGPDPRDPRSLRLVRPDYLGCLDQDGLTGMRIALTPDLGGLVPTETAVLDRFEDVAARFSSLGASVETVQPDFSDLPAVMSGTRAFGMVGRYAGIIEHHREKMSQQLINQVEGSLKMTLADVVRGERLRTEYWHRLRPLLTGYDAIVTPATGTPAFRLDKELPTEVGGRKVERFLDTMVGLYAFSVVDAAVTAVPCGLTGEGLPVGLQIVGGSLSEERALRVAVAWERAFPELFAIPDVDPKTPVSEELKAFSGGISIRA